MTLIVLLILAAVSLSAVFSDKGVFSRAENAGAKYNEAKAREVLETVLMTDGQMEKHTNPKYNQDEFLDELIKSEIPGSDIKGDVAIIGEYAYELDRSVPKIKENLGIANNLTFPNLSLNKKIAEDAESGTIEITAKEEENGISKIEIIYKGEKLKEYLYTNKKDEIKESYPISQNGEYIVKVYSKLKVSKVINITELSGFTKNRDILKIGDYVEYIPDTAENYIVSSSQSGSGENSAEGIHQQKDLKWRIARINKNGTVDLISTTPILDELYIYGTIGSGNLQTLLNDISQKQYSNENLHVTGFALELSFANSLKATDINNDLINSANNVWLAGSWSTGNYYQQWGAYVIEARRNKKNSDLYICCKSSKWTNDNE